MSEVLPTSVPWYESEEDFLAILKLVPPSETRGASYEAYLSAIRQSEDFMRRNGNLSIRVTIKPAAIKVWCDDNGAAICRASIAEYARDEMMKRLDRKGTN